MNWFDDVDYGVPNGTPSVGLKTMTKNTPHTLFIVLSGKKQTGKDTAATFITKLLQGSGKRVVISAFAEPLKRMCIEILGLNRAEVYGTDAQKNALSHIMWDGFPLDIRLKYSKEYVGYDPGRGSSIEIRSQWLPRTGPMTNREVLQVMGTDIFREIYGDVWAKAPFNADWKDTDVVILADCRFPNEKKVTEDAGGIIIRLERSTGLNDNHASETALDECYFEHTFKNNGSIEDLENYLRDRLKASGLI